MIFRRGLAGLDSDMRCLFALPFLAGGLIATLLPAAAQIPDDLAQLELRPGWRASNGTHMSGLDIRLAPGWKTYWRSPGDGGIPPRLMLEPSDNIRSVQFSWPVPEVFDQNGLRSIGYSDGVLLPLAIKTIDPDAPILLRGRIEIGVCEDICIPVTFPIEARLTPGAGPDPSIRAALADRPMTAAEAGAGAVTCVIEPISDGMQVTARFELAPLTGQETAVLELNAPGVWVSETSFERTGTRVETIAEMVPPEGKPFLLDRSSVRITVIGQSEAVDLGGC